MIIKSILDTDLYKFTTSYAYMKLFPQARGTFEFIDRDNTEYPEDFIERLYLELGSLGMLHLAKDEQEYMNNNCSQPIFGCVKLSDDAGKHTGKVEDVQRCLTDLGYAYRVP